ncbi:MAG: PilC/PilY family type IV pilus protein [Psychrobacter sp.]
MKHLRNQNSAIRSWPIKTLTSAVIISLTAMVSQTVSSAERKPIGDLEIYKSAEPGTASIFMMLDVSGSMDERSIEADYGRNCDQGNNNSYQEVESETIIAVVLDKNGNIKEEISFTPKGCTVKGTKRFDRLSRLQRALIELIADEVYEKGNKKIENKGSLPNEYAIGIGIFGYGNGTKGKVLTPVGKLTPEQRITLIEEINDLDPSSNTPTAHALAEAGAYMMGTTTYTSSYSSYSGFNDSVSISKKDENYISPLSNDQCSGNGIYLLTDGEPNGSNNDTAKGLMNKSLQGSSLSVNTCDALSGGSSSGAWGCMAEYTKKLRDPTNPGKLPIKTATVGFGSSFGGLTGTRTILTRDKELKEVIDCDSGKDLSTNVRNLCKLGERKGENEEKTFGDGGFYYVEANEDSTTTIASSIVDFATTLIQIINTAPSGTITIPDDPYRVANQLPYAYLPMLNPEIASSASIWKGNLKKYNLDNGSLYGKSNNLLYKDVAGQLNETTQDVWQTADFKKEEVIANNEIEAGGVYAQLRSPNSGLGSVRSLYVEDYTLSTNKTPVLRKLGVDASGKPQGFDQLKDTVTYSQLNQRRLLSFLGFDNLIDINGLPTSSTPVEDLVLSQPTKEIKILGGVVHSKPTAISYSSALDDNGSIINPSDDYVLFGSMDGALHLVDADDGKEEVAIIPKAMLETQPEALVEDSTKANVGQPYFGVDAPWLVTTNYTYDLIAKQVTLDTANNKGMFAYGGLRMGGEAFYGMDISNKSTPKILFTITPEGLRSIAPAKSTTIGFERLGRIWNKPTAAKIRLSKGADPIDVLVFGGGYDMGYEQDSYKPTVTTPARGNAIYMINANTGELIWSASGETGGSKNTKTDTMIHSIVGGITVLDRDNDGLMDHLYAADLGGQMFRSDFQNARPANTKLGFSEIASFSNKRVIRVLNTAPSAPNDKYAYRFYERPVVSFYRNEGISGQTIVNNGKLFAMVNVISGNRSAPLSTLRDGDTYANRIYGIIDEDVTKTSLYDATPTLKIKDLTESNLVNLGSTLGAAPNNAQKTAAKAEMIAGTKHGWYYPLTRFDGYNRVRYNKGVGDSIVINDLLYTTVYNPDKQYGDVPSCTARIAGGSERQLYCLPYGICMDAKSISGTGGYVPAGQGIQELTLGAYNKDSTDTKVLIGTTTITDRIDAAKRSGYGADANKNGSNIKNIVYGNNGKPTQSDANVIGDGSAAEFIFNERYTLQPRAWYKQTQ